MHQLTAFEHIAAGSGLQLVRLRRGDELVFQAAFRDWIAVDLEPQKLMFEEKQDLVIECMGPVLPYWDGMLPSWLTNWDLKRETQRIQDIKQAYAAEIRRTMVTLNG